MKIAIVDDERPARSELKFLLEQCDSKLVVMEADSWETMMELMEREHPQGAFVDIQLGGRNGATLASMLLKNQPGFALVFATAYQEYAVKAFELGALDYLLKPYSVDQVARALKRMTEKIKASDPSGEEGQEIPMAEGGASRWRPRTTEPSDNRPRHSLYRLTVTGAEGVELLDVTQILYISTEERGCSVHLKGREIYQNQTLNYYEERLADYDFFRIYKSYLVNLDCIEKFVPSYNNGYGVCLKGVEGRILPIGRSQCKELRKMFEF